MGGSGLCQDGQNLQCHAHMLISRAFALNIPSLHKSHKRTTLSKGNAHEASVPYLSASFTVLTHLSSDVDVRLHRHLRLHPVHHSARHPDRERPPPQPRRHRLLPPLSHHHHLEGSTHSERSRCLLLQQHAPGDHVRHLCAVVGTDASAATARGQLYGSGFGAGGVELELGLDEGLELGLQVGAFAGGGEDRTAGEAGEDDVGVEGDGGGGEEGRGRGGRGGGRRGGREGRGRGGGRGRGRGEEGRGREGRREGVGARAGEAEAVLGGGVGEVLGDVGQDGLWVGLEGTGAFRAAVLRR